MSQKEIRKTIGERFHDERDDRKLSQRSLDEATGVGKDAIRSLESLDVYSVDEISSSPQYRGVAFDKVAKLAEFYDTSIDYLLGRDVPRSMEKDVRQASFTTGLSDRAVSTLKEMDRSDHRLFTLSRLIEDHYIHGEKSVLSQISRYLSIQEKQSLSIYDQGKDKIDIGNIIEHDGEVFLFSDAISERTLRRICNCLEDMREDMRMEYRDCDEEHI